MKFIKSAIEGAFLRSRPLFSTSQVQFCQPTDSPVLISLIGSKSTFCSKNNVEISQGVQERVVFRGIRSFSTKKKPKEVSKAQTEDKDAERNQNEGENCDFEVTEEGKAHEPKEEEDVETSLHPSANIILEILGGGKQTFGRKAQNGKIRKKPIALTERKSKETANEASALSSDGQPEPLVDSQGDDPKGTENLASEKPENDQEDSEVSTDDSPPTSVTTQFTLPIIHFSSSKRVHALPALGLFRKPAFPGFYQVLQIQDQAVLQCLSNVKQSSGHDYVGGFLTKKEKTTEVNIQSLPMLREDAGSVKSHEDMHLYGTLLQIITITPNLSFQGGQVILMPHKRIKMTGIYSDPSDSYPLYRVAVEYIEDAPKHYEDSSVTKALHLEIISTVKELIKTSHFYKEHFDQIIRFYNLDHPTRLADLIAGISLAKRDQLQNILAELNIDRRLTMVLEIAKNDLEFAKVQNDVNAQLEEKLSKDQRKYILTEQMKMIKKELGLDNDDKSTVIESFEKEFLQVSSHMSDEAKTSFNSGISRLKHLESSSAEFGVWRSYLEWLVGLPWGKSTEESRDIHKAKQVLDSHHFGLKDVKTRLLEFMATSILNGHTSGKIICLTGPPGVGKTSIAIAMAESLNRKLYRLSLGGLFDVAEIKGHRRTYVGALPGKFVQALKYTGTMNPLIVLDEIDKLGRDTRGDPASALLEALDPSQNANFRDHYLDIPVDLSKVLFICTANTTDTIPIPLLDRMELITIPGYLPEEKHAISKNFLIPQAQKNTGLTSDVINIEDSAVDCIIRQYSREAGVRNLLKCIEKIHRKVALDIVWKKSDKENVVETTTSTETTDGESADSDAVPTAFPTGKEILSSISEKIVVTDDKVQSYLGVPIFTKETMHPYPLPYGVVLGLAWTNAGGATLYVEAHGQILNKLGKIIEPDRSAVLATTDDKPDDASNFGNPHGTLKVTGHLGTVMTESSQIALTYCKTFIRRFQPNNIFLDEAHIHVHVPEGATPKDGPSAGITMASALISLAAKKRLKPSIAMTGELTISGKVLRVGGIKEKLIAAIREDVRTVVLPKGNMADVDELDSSIKDKLSFVFVDSFDEVYDAVFEE
ncbi:ATP-dependent protease La, putative [Theileria equi strain WA]|uniref:Lon protease homolog n=1 Tax=Theileria equi strain WA TaxID=1537102 RepID=L0AVH3_THEEQ|nr:ATP-dependent protease La, putative [Theileria equi strain WA]AFZ79248.1 ATP-dependent protease La, putative [Theileria equi strain WA]|eukprot:XP_004828914.1 ATP-dependent protease La, putative [Theileria equi strain WA]